MDKKQKQRLEADGWKVGDAEDFLEMSEEERTYLEIRLLAESLRRRRKHERLTQTALAKKLRSSQSRIAKMEAGDPSVSLDLLIRALLALGLGSSELAQIIAGPQSATA